MINAGKLLADLKRLRKGLDADPRATHATGAQRDAVQAEWREAFDLGRTRDTFEAFLDGVFDQAVVHWVLGCVFLRFLEDNLLVDRPFLSGPGERLELAKERQEAHFRALPHDSDTEYLLATFEEAARLPGLAGLFDPAHNPLFRLPLSGDGAMALIRFFRDVLPETGELAHDFTDPDWNTRFLGDLYQDLSEEARKRYALLQTPDFVESWILDRTLEPAIREFGHERATMIDPACGSGHFLLGGFTRLLREWQRLAPGLPPAEQAQRALDAVAGVDLNPFAVEIARFRLLVAALRAADVHRLAAAPSFVLHLAAGDSLLHGRHFFRNELGGSEEGFRRVLRHHFMTEDSEELDPILGRQYHAVVGNPPYIVPKDAAMRDAYREIYESCYGKYGFGAPFTERFFDLAITGKEGQSPGFIGLIVANSFMKREFGAKLIESVLARTDLTHVIDCSGAYIPGHGTPTAILFGRNRAPVASVVRTVRRIRGEPSTPIDPSKGLVWSAILAQTDVSPSQTDYISTEDTSRVSLMRHPWNLGGGGATDVQATIEENRSVLGSRCTIGVMAVTLEDDAYVRSRPIDFARNSVMSDLKSFVEGERVRDWQITEPLTALFPYDSDGNASVSRHGGMMLWPVRTTLRANLYFGKIKEQRGMRWFEFGILTRGMTDNRPAISFAFVATHNHFVFDDAGRIFNRSAPVIKLPRGAATEEHLALLGLLNSSTACFWMKQIFYPKGGDHVGQEGARVSRTTWDDRYEFTGSGLEQFPLAEGLTVDIVGEIAMSAQRLVENLPVSVIGQVTPTRAALDRSRAIAQVAHRSMIALQEELDWRCYRLYGLHEMPPEHPKPPPLQFGERAFEIVMARQLAAGTLETAWFERHGSTPITGLPSHWPDDYRRVVEQRIALIETDANIGMIERPEFKRRWSIESWEEMEQEALRAWLLDRMESPSLWATGDARLLSTNQLTDLLRRDADFLSVAEL